MSKKQTPDDPSDCVKAFAKQAIYQLEQSVERLSSQGEDPNLLTPLLHQFKSILHQANAYQLNEFIICLEQVSKVLEGITDNRLNYCAQVQTYCLFALDECIQICQYVLDDKPIETNQDIAASYEYIAAFIEPPTEQSISAIPLDIFYEEVIELLGELNKSLSLADKDPDTMIIEIKRHLHTLKGSARLVGYKSLGDFLHDVEEKMDGDVKQGCQIIKALVGYLSNHAKHILEAKPIVINWDTLNEQIQTNAYVHNLPSSLQEGESVEKLRIPLSAVERFGKLAATSNMTRSHAELQLHALKVRVNSLTTSIRKLKEQTKHIERLAVSRVNNVAYDVQSDDFDPLEMDRYTQLQYFAQETRDTTAHIASLHEDAGQGICEIEDTLREQGRSTQFLEHGLRQVRMIAFAKLVPRLDEMVKQISEELDKKVKLTVIEAEGELDRSVMEKLISPIEHMLRNAIDHGIEASEDRLALKKSPVGEIKVILKRQGAYIVIQIEDDGCGLDTGAIKAIAYSKGWWQLDREPTESEIIQLIFQPGFSTSQETTLVSGRGIGLDVVHAQIKKMGGHLRVESNKQLGTTFRIQLPFTSSLNQAFIFELNSQLFGVLVSHVTAIARVNIEQLISLQQMGKPFEYLGIAYEFSTFSSSNLVEIGEAKNASQDFPVLLIDVQDVHLAIVLDRAVGPREILLQAIGPQMQYMDGIIGASILSTDQIALILDPIGLATEGETISFSQPKERLTLPNILVVDDSITVRKVTERILLKNQFEVMSAKDGIEAIEILGHSSIDCILLDLEMPRMDGFTFLKWLRAQPRFDTTSVIVISSRSLEKYKSKAEEMGVTCFLSKPYQEDDLIYQIQQAVGLNDAT